MVLFSEWNSKIRQVYSATKYLVIIKGNDNLCYSQNEWEGVDWLGLEDSEEGSASWRGEPFSPGTTPA